MIAAVVILLVRRRRKQNEIQEQEDIPLPVATEFPSITLDSVTNESQVRKQLESLAKKSQTNSSICCVRGWLTNRGERIGEGRQCRINWQTKAAILLITLGPEVSAQIFKHLRDEEIEAAYVGNCQRA